MKKDFGEILDDNLNKDFSFKIDNLNSKMKSRALKVLNSKNLKEFEKVDLYKPFSVIMALYNNEQYLEDAIESLVVQSFGFKHNVELIIVDDGSSDDSLKIVRKYQRKISI